MSVTWNKKMRKTAGYCITGQEKGGGDRYARIELSDKVCDSAGETPKRKMLCSDVWWRVHMFPLGPVSEFSSISACLRSSQGHADPWNVPRCHVADKRREGRTRKLMEAVRTQIHTHPSWAAHGDALPQLWHHVQVPVSVQALPEYVSLSSDQAFPDQCFPSTLTSDLPFLIVWLIQTFVL